MVSYDNTSKYQNIFILKSKVNKDDSNSLAYIDCYISAGQAKFSSNSSLGRDKQNTPGKGMGNISNKSPLLAMLGMKYSRPDPDVNK